MTEGEAHIDYTFLTRDSDEIGPQSRGGPAYFSIFLSRLLYAFRSAKSVAVGVGFEPTGLSPNGFQDRRLKPLGHPTMSFYINIITHIKTAKNTSKII